MPYGDDVRVGEEGVAVREGRLVAEHVEPRRVEPVVLEGIHKIAVEVQRSQGGPVDLVLPARLYSATDRV